MATLTKPLIESEPAPEKGQRFIFDDHRDAPRGFGLRITAAGGRAFILKYAVEGIQRRMTIGDWPTWSLKAARVRAQELRREIDSGIDPLQAKRDHRAALTVKQAVERYTENHLEHLLTATEAKRYFERDILPALGDLKVAEVRRRDLVALVEVKARTAPRAARVLLGHLKHFMAWCELREIIELSPAHGIKPAAVDRRMKTSKRGRALDDKEIREFWTQAETCGLHRLTALALKLILLTGQRPGEVAGMTWAEVEGNLWTIPASRRGKTRDDHPVPLTKTALALLDQAREEVARLCKRRKEDPGPHVFEMKGGEPITVRALTRAVTRYRKALGNRDHTTWGHWTPHDLRRTCRTGLAAVGVIQEVAERVVGHIQDGIVGVYDVHRYDAEKRAALEAWERRLLRIVAGELDQDNIVPLRTRKS